MGSNVLTRCNVFSGLDGLVFMVGSYLIILLLPGSFIYFYILQAALGPLNGAMESEV